MDMARTQSPQFDERQDAITRQAAILFAKYGFLGASVAKLAEACDTSKSLIYHYFPSKEDILYGVMSKHLDDLVAIEEKIMALPPCSAEIRFRKLTAGFVEAYVDAGASHKVLLNELDNLPKDNRSAIVARQHEIIENVETLLASIRPELSTNKDFIRPTSMLFFGMINWTHTWFHASGPVSPAQLAEMVADVMLAGLHQIKLGH
jgi:AcrR family transcriptional regulator